MSNPTLLTAASQFRAAVLSMIKSGESWSYSMDKLSDELLEAILEEVRK